MLNIYAQALLDTLNKKFQIEYGYDFIRCSSCVLPIIYKEYILLCKNKTSDYSSLKVIVQDINNAYLNSSDTRIEDCKSKVLCCGYDCIHYEENPEACPFPFWEIDKSQFPELLKTLKKLYQMNISLE